MKKDSIAKFSFDSKITPETDWSVFDVMSENERHAVALSDPDRPPATDEQLEHTRRANGAP